MRSRKQAAMKTPPEKQEQRLMKVSQRVLEERSELCLSCENSLRGSIPQRNVMTIMANRVTIFSV